MKIYFRIQWNIINRHIKDAGLNMILAWILALISFIGLSIVLFSKYEYTEYIYLVIPTFLSLRLTDIKRNEFLKICYGDRRFYLIRFLENLIISIPFLLILLIHQKYLISIFLLVFIPLLTLFRWKSVSQIIIPTPFQKRPFEFTVGFRRSFLLIILIYVISFIAIRVDNFNLGLFTLLLSFLTSISYYSFMENEFYVWSHKDKPNGFLWKKILIGVMMNSILYFLLMVMLLFSFPENMVHILILYAIGVFFMIAVIFMKYAAFPHRIGLKESIVMSISSVFSTYNNHNVSIFLLSFH